MRIVLSLAILLLGACGTDFSLPEHHASAPTAPDLSVYDANLAEGIGPTVPLTTAWVGDSYVTLGDWDMWFPGSQNLGVGGETVEMVRDRVAKMTSLPPTVYLWCGINDLNARTPWSQIFPAYSDLIDHCLAIGAHRVICLSVLPLGHAYPFEFGPDWTPDIIGELNDNLHSTALAHHAEWIDLTPAVADAQGWCADAYSEPSGIHINAAGYARVVSLIRASLPVLRGVG